MKIENCGVCLDYSCTLYGCRKYRFHNDPVTPSTLPQQVQQNMEFEKFADIVAAKVVALLGKQKKRRAKR